MYCKIPEFIGPFKDILPEYINYQRGLGYDYSAPIVYRLREMDIFFHEHGYIKPEITEEMYELWTAHKGSEKKSTQGKRMSAINGFSKYLINSGYKNIYLGDPARGVFKSHFIPYIFSEEEIQSIFSVLKEELRTESNKYDVATFTALFSLYYSCGLRKSEAQHLLIRDIDLNTGKIRLMDGKNHISRIIVVSESMRKQLLIYHDEYCIGCGADAFIFRDENGKCFSERKIYRIYKIMLKKASIPFRKGGQTQRIHDLRHTFCVRALETMIKKGYDLYTSLPLLSTYLGHKHITETEYYLRLLDEHFGLITEMSSKYAPNLFPKAGDINA
ncbi:MAG TPA: tyrosine-type recombinase/integrase [Candidatus Wunengus californicus]|uniref:tyrosine-type recombinase/integrase n=1 Tax=Candidatus Wunengus californicus TaxID=3367619 RepID=UPI004025CA81